MKITLNIVGPIKKPAKKFNGEIKSGESVEDVLLRIGYTKTDLRYFLITVNGERKQLDHKLKGKDVLEIFLPVGGG